MILGKEALMINWGINKVIGRVNNQKIIQVSLWNKNLRTIKSVI